MEKKANKKIVIIGAGFAGLEAAKILSKQQDLDIVIIDRRNYHLFQPLLYQVAMAGLNGADIAEPIRAVFANKKNVSVYQAEVTRIDAQARLVHTDFRDFEYDYVLLATGSVHHYFGSDTWEEHAPGLKTLAQAMQIRNRVLTALERAEKAEDSKERARLMTFVIVGAGPTGVELAGAIGEMALFTLKSDFRNIDSSDARVILIDSKDRVLNTFSEKLSKAAERALTKLNVQIIHNSRATDINSEGVQVGDEFIAAGTVLWAAGVKPSRLGEYSNFPLDALGRVVVNDNLNIEGHNNVFVAGDIACAMYKGVPLPGVAPVAMQQGIYVAKAIIADMKGVKRSAFAFFDKGSMATIGRSKAIMQSGPIQLSGFIAWLAWLGVHIAYLIRYKNRFFTMIQWGMSYFFYRRGARLIIRNQWKRRPSDM